MNDSNDFRSMLSFLVDCSLALRPVYSCRTERRQLVAGEAVRAELQSLDLAALVQRAQADDVDIKPAIIEHMVVVLGARSSDEVADSKEQETKPHPLARAMPDGPGKAPRFRKA